MSIIEEYRFGSIVIDGKAYNYDVEIRWTGEILPWPREESHVVNVEDIKRAIDQMPEMIIIGTGESGFIRVEEELKQLIKANGVELVIDITGEATKTFNIVNEESEEEEGRQKKVIGLFHLTC